jgi:hypothetical protein
MTSASGATQTGILLCRDSLPRGARSLLHAALIERRLDRFANHNAAIHRRKSTNLAASPLINTHHLAFRVDLGGPNIVGRLRKKHIHLHRIPRRRRAPSPDVNAAAADIAAVPFAALQGSVFIAPGEDNRKTQTKTSRFSPLGLRLVHRPTNPAPPPPAYMHSDVRGYGTQQRLYASRQICKDDDSGLRRTTPPCGFLNRSPIRTLFSAREGDKSLSRGASSGVLRVLLKGLAVSNPRNVGQREFRGFSFPPRRPSHIRKRRERKQEMT